METRTLEHYAPIRAPSGLGFFSASPREKNPKRIALHLTRRYGAGGVTVV